MGSKKQKANYEQNNQYEFMTPPKTQEAQNFEQFQPMANPAVPYQFAGLRKNLMSSFNNPLGPYATPEMRQQQQQGSLMDIAQMEGQANREAQFDRDRLKLGQLGQAAEMAQPRMVQTKGYGYQEQFVPTIWNSVIQAGAQAGSAAIM